MGFSSNLTSGWRPIYPSTRPPAPSLPNNELTGSRCVFPSKRMRALSRGREEPGDGQGTDGHTRLTELGTVVEMEYERRPRFCSEWEYVIERVGRGLEEVPGHDDLHFPESPMSGRETDQYHLDDVQNATI
jgi:hypothetical protein